MCCKNNIFAYNLITGQVARWVFVGQNTFERTRWCGRESSVVAFFLGKLNEKDYMGKNGENKSRKVTIRFTEKEWAGIEEQMANYDYLSISRYIRDKVLNKRIKIDRSIVLTDRVFRNQINSLSAIVARIGVDYNQATKRFNSLVKQKRADGSPVINSRAANYYLKQIQSMTQELKDAMDKIIEMVEALELKEAAPEAESVNNTLNQ